MNILSHFYEHKQNNFIFHNLKSLHEQTTSPLFTARTSFTYTNIVESIGKNIYELARLYLQSWLEDMDTSFRHSPQRKERYHVKNTRARTIITPYGEITYTRTLYSFKDGSKGIYTHVDEILGIPKYDRYDPCVKAQMISLYANHNSMIKVGKLIGEKIYAPFSLDAQRFRYAIPRQTVQNTIKKAGMIMQPFTALVDTPEDLYIMADEKWVPLQSHDEEGNKQKQMVKAAVIFEDIGCVQTKIPTLKSRHELINKHVLLSTENNFWERAHDAINELYDLEKVKRIHILGDGATWIKAAVRELSTQSTKTDFSLDKFHLHQSLTRIEKDKEIRKKLFEYIVINQSRKLFNTMIEILIKDSPHREETIRREQQYLLNNWKAIQNAHHHVSMGCSMESAISHIIASCFTSVPKGYSKKNLSIYINNREHHENKIDVSKLYIQSLDYKEEDGIKRIKKALDFSVFDRNRQQSGKAGTSHFIKGIIAKN